MAAVAGLVRVMTPVALLPFTIVDGETANELNSEGPTSSAAVCVVPCNEAVIVAVVLLAPAGVVMENVADELPAAIVTVAGTLAAALLEESDTVRFAAAAPVKATLPVAVPPLGTVDGETVSEASCGARTYRLAEVVY